MKVVEISGFEIGCALPERQGNSTGFVDRIGSLLISIKTDGGLVGWGETWAMPEAASTLIRQKLAGIVLGRNPLDRGVIWHELVAQRGYDRRGLTMMAVSALDLALWDVCARGFGVSVAQLLGGRVRDNVLAYASGPYFRTGPDPYSRFPSETESYLARGFKAIKLRLGTDPEADRALCLAIRRLIGPDRLLMVDLNQGFDIRSSLAIAHAISEARIEWMEEPLPPDDVEGYRRLAVTSPIALAAGEALAGCEAFGDFLPGRCFDVVQPDLAICGGLTEGLRIANMAYAANTAVTPHVIGSFVNFHAALQLAAVLPARPARSLQKHPIFEFDQTPNVLRAIVPEPPLEADGTIAVPLGPGWGFEVDPDRLEPFVTDRWTVRL